MKLLFLATTLLFSLVNADAHGEKSKAAKVGRTVAYNNRYMDNYIYTVKIVNVDKYAHFRSAPFGKIIKHLSVGTHLVLENCNTKESGFTWCYSKDFGGGYIAEKLLSWTEIKNKK